jgi:hypothetical protein
MNAPFKNSRFSRRTILKGGALTVGFALTGLPAKGSAQGLLGASRVLDPKEVDAFLAVNGDGTVTIFSGKVDLGQGLRISFRQIVAEELGVAIDKINLIEGDTALTPDQGRTSGSNGIQRGGMQLRRASATARNALFLLAAQKLNVKADEIKLENGVMSPRAGGKGVTFADLLGGKRFDLKLDPKAPLKDPKYYTIVGKRAAAPTCRRNARASMSTFTTFPCLGMLHGRVIRPPRSAQARSVDESSVKDLPGVKVVRIKDFLAIVANDEWTAVRAARALKAQWSAWSGLPVQDKLLRPCAAIRTSPIRFW